MLFSIIIPVRNRATLVERTLQCVVAQTYRPLQVVLVDNDSTDGTLDTLLAFKTLHESADLQVVVAQESHHTAGAARNRGFSKATGEWVLFFDSDDEMDPRLVQSYADCIEKADDDLDLISAKSTLRFASGNERSAPFHTHDIIANHILHGQLATQRYAVRRSFFGGTDGWNIDLPRWNDYELGLRLLLAAPRMGYLKQDHVTIHHYGTDSITGRDFYHSHGQLEYVLTVMLNEVACSQLKPKYRLRFSRLLEYRRIVLAAHYEREGHPELAKPLCLLAYGRLGASYGNSCRWRWWTGPMVQRLFSNIVHRSRGAARVARLLF